MTYIVFLNYKLLFLPPKLTIFATKPYHVSHSMPKQTQWTLGPGRLGSAWAFAQSSQSACRMHGSLASHWVQMPRLIWVYAGCKCNFVGLVMHMLISLSGFSLSENRLYVNKGQELRRPYTLTLRKTLSTKLSLRGGKPYLTIGNELVPRTSYTKTPKLDYARVYSISVAFHINV